MKKLITGLAIALLLSSPAYAQKTKAQLTTEVNANFPDNTTGLITPAIQRTTLIDMINSWYGLIDSTNSGTGQVTAGGFAGSAVPAASILSLSGQYTLLSSTDGIQSILMGVADPSIYYRSTNHIWRDGSNNNKASLTTGSTPVFTVGNVGLSPGQFALAGTVGGAITVAAPGTSSSYNFNLPTTAGLSGQALISGGGGATAMSWSSVAIVLPGYIGGLVLSNDGGSPNTVIDIASGVASDSTGAAYMQTGAFTKSTGGAWAAGSGSNGMGNGLTVAVNTWYHVCMANNLGSPEFWFDTSAICANRPAGISDVKFRRVGSFKTATGTTNILAFTQVNDTFFWTVGILDSNATVVGTTAANFTLTVPTGVVVEAFFNVAAFTTAAGTSGNVYPLAVTDQTVSFGTFANIRDPSSGVGIEVPVRIMTDTSARVRVRSAAAGMQTSIYTTGWRDFRGQ